MRQDETISETRADTFDQLIGQSDLGYEVNNLQARLKMTCNQAQVDFSFTASGYRTIRT